MLNPMDESEIEASLETESQAFSKQSHQFWTLQIVGWLGYAIFVFLAIVRPQIAQPNFNFSGKFLIY